MSKTKKLGLRIKLQLWINHIWINWTQPVAILCLAHLNSCCNFMLVAHLERVMLACRAETGSNAGHQEVGKCSTRSESWRMHNILPQKWIRQSPLWLWNPEETSSEIQNMGTSGPKIGHLFVSAKNMAAGFSLITHSRIELLNSRNSLNSERLFDWYKHRS